MDVYEALGVRKVINGSGTLTSLGGNTLDPEVTQAMEEAARSFVFMDELQKRAGDVIAEITGAESAYVVSGAAAGLMMSVVACISRGDLATARNLPENEGLRCEILVQAPHKSVYVTLVRIAGGRTVYVGGPQRTTEGELQEAMGEDTAAILYIDFDPQESVVPLSRVIELAHLRGIPVIVDAAAELPPVENLRRYISLGSDLVVFSGGKDIGGPSDTGFVCGRKSLVDACFALGPYYSATVNGERTYFLGRAMKTSKEDIAALVVALRTYPERSKEKVERCESVIDSLIDGLSKIPHIHVKRVLPGPEDTIRPLTIPRVQVEQDPYSTPVEEALRVLESGNPPIKLYSIGKSLFINPQCLTQEEVPIIVERLKWALTDGASRASAIRR
jgi:uncharacterized pyridoxal phosphate-dependent enzyme